jgi:multiple sugar transport system substrate-binding protein
VNQCFSIEGKDIPMGRTSFRRRLVGVALAGVTALAAAGCGLTGGDDGGNGSGTVELRFSWWGNTDRAGTTQ